MVYLKMFALCSVSKKHHRVRSGTQKWQKVKLTRVTATPPAPSRDELLMLHRRQADIFSPGVCASYLTTVAQRPRSKTIGAEPFETSFSLSHILMHNQRINPLHLKNFIGESVMLCSPAHLTVQHVHTKLCNMCYCGYPEFEGATP